MKRYKVDISPFAYTEILDSVAFLMNASKEAAEELYKVVMEGISSLQEFPFRCPVDSTYNVASEEERKMLFCNGRYQLFYCVSDDVVYVECFHDSRRK